DVEPAPWCGFPRWGLLVAVWACGGPWRVFAVDVGQDFPGFPVGESGGDGGWLFAAGPRLVDEGSGLFDGDGAGPEGCAVGDDRLVADTTPGWRGPGDDVGGGERARRAGPDDRGLGEDQLLDPAG